MKNQEALLLFFSFFISAQLLSQCFPSQQYNTGGSYSYTLPAGDIYRISITISGAHGGNANASNRRGGTGASMNAFFDLAGNDKLDIYVGSSGQNGPGFSGGGGGATAVVLNNNTLLMVAGGGGGASQNAHGTGGIGFPTSFCMANCGGNAGLASGGGGINEAGAAGVAGSTGGGAGVLTAIASGGTGTNGSGNGGNGWSGGGGGMGQFGGGGGGYEGGNGSGASNIGGSGGIPYFSFTNNGGINFQNDGTNGGSNNSDGSVFIQCLVLLDVEFVSFDGKNDNNAVVLEWQTASENNNTGFEVEQSIDGKTWNYIDFVAGKGTSFDLNSYRFKHSSPAVGLNYYRLKQIDIDGTYQYSTIIAIKHAPQQSNLLLYPNPSSGLVKLELEKASKQAIHIEISDHLGRPVWQTTQTIATPNWEQEVKIKENGLYFLTARIGDEIHYKKLIVNDN